MGGRLLPGFVLCGRARLNDNRRLPEEVALRAKGGETQDTAPRSEAGNLQKAPRPQRERLPAFFNSDRAIPRGVAPALPRRHPIGGSPLRSKNRQSSPQRSSMPSLS